jgi:sigma-E factor negative regulatory protein RseA
MSLQVGSEPAPQMAMQQTPSALRPASFSSRGGLNDYLMAHQEYSPSADVQGTASYMRTGSGQ